MFPYIPNTEEDKKEMLEVVGLQSQEQLFDVIPENLRLRDGLDLPDAKSELEVATHLQNLADKNVTVNQMPCFIGGGAYDRYIPSIIGHILGRQEFYTSYTPYQPEVSQGTTQYIFEYQSLISRLTGMEISNASLYDCGTAVMEASIMTSNVAKKKKVIVSESVDPQYREVLDTYAHMRGIEVVVAPMKDMATDFDALKELVDDKTASVVVQSPNYYGYYEEVEKVVELTHSFKKCYTIMATDPISLAISKKPGDYGVDVCVAEGQSLGLPLAFGGPYLGIFACTKDFLRKMPGRIVGQTEDLDGKRSWVLTLSAREQHIRRDKATSNICSNQGVNTLATAVYMATMGKQGMKEVALQSTAKAHYMYDELLKLDGVEAFTDRPFFDEFTIKTSVDAQTINDRLYENGIMGGINIEKFNNELGHGMIIAVTEKRKKSEIDKFVEVVKEAF
ncbi:aminomethyl-transferring glycine dehydrogenase subunit GcvPA [Gallicola sp. Sow4_E12]|uniref:aminomethyl-transferring glycine dehydrogenase subunit GcvPA n=1 Tax=Gallicola sp. Sow4_E12 TaxID=3438785 RepID=UPI003F937499